ncbi:MAG: signal peptidase I [Spirochaetia bacterium]|nr:signal peptidase I [Spirochaetia bacterium]
MDFLNNNSPVTKYKSNEKIKNEIKKYGIPLLIIFFWVIFLQYIIREFLIYPVKIQENYMNKTLSKGDLVFLTYTHLADINKGDIVFVELKKYGMKTFCRIIGLPGENIEIKNKKIFINEKEFNDIWASQTDNRILPQKISNRDNLTKTSIRPGHYFCINDNRDNISDSRQWGPLSYSSIMGKVLAVNLLGI